MALGWVQRPCPQPLGLALEGGARSVCGGVGPAGRRLPSLLPQRALRLLGAERGSDSGLGPSRGLLVQQVTECCALL